MTAEEIRKMATGDIIKAVENSREELFNLRFQRTSNKLENPMRFRIVRKDIARMLTVLRERELQIKSKN